ncbi:MAG: Trm112 family protein [Verrucomicrobiota bacterium]
MESDVAPEIAAFFRCPVTKQRLRFVASEDEEGSWVTEDGRVAYPVEDGFPILKPEAGKTRQGHSADG